MWNRSFLHAVVPFMLACMFSAPVSRAAEPAPLPQPDIALVTDGTIFALAKQPDGSVIAGGDFTAINGVTHSNLARFHPDGTLDEAWHASTDGPVMALLIGLDGSLFVGGFFTEAGGKPRYFLAKFAPDGSLDPQWVASANSLVRSLAIGTDGSVFVGGYFSEINNESRNRLAKLSPDGVGALDPDWAPGADGSVSSMQVDPSGTLYAAGGFSMIGGVNQPYLARLSASGSGTVDTGWSPAPDDLVGHIRLDGAGWLYAAGRFTSIGAQPISYLARVSASGPGAVDATWNPAPDAPVFNTLIGSDASIYVGGAFNSIGGLPRDHIAKISPDGSGAVDVDWNPGVNGVVQAMIPRNAGKLFIGGAFSTVGGTERHSLVEVDVASGLAGTALDATLPGKAFAVAVQDDGGAIVGGRFFAAGGERRDSILRLLPDGTLDPAWKPEVTQDFDVGYRQVATLAIDANDDVYIGGSFETIDDQPRASLAKLAGHGNGALDAAWAPAADGYVDVIVLDGKGSLFAGGMFTTMDGQPRAYLAKLDAAGSGTLDAAWDPQPDYIVYDIAIDAAGAMYIGGDFSSVGGQPRNFVAKLSSTGSGAVDLDWRADADFTVFALVPDDKGSVFAGGWFSNIAGTARGGLAKLDAASGAPDPDWNPSTSPIGASISAMALDGDSLFVGGSFVELDKQPLQSIAKLSTKGIGEADSAFNPGVGDGPNGSEGLLDLALGDGVLYVGGGFTVIGGKPRHGIAALPIAAPDHIFDDGFDG